ncbi:TerC/Alx family metal homeostasis membrane protein [Kineosporia rhizophila]|uniref:TerC/Alx family metal homeostasis membrane protein n=1 Tax=Kineosporia TaxID=49184 RepID=UPI000A672B3F|nr:MULTISPECIES: TerC/Alx family metal homeostasis membrane protein [Kineosporia]MCE0534162.1 TerC/Alx family metal homeostasis membrane protein [Kineosporia rhizophila]GLY13708.1 integral membrane protein TerC [Kineosporia sp. NBRC 101677]
MDVSAAWWIATIALVLGITAVDLVANRGQTHITIQHATRWVLFYVGVALAFGVAIWIGFGPSYGGQFIAGWLTEYSLSADNLFVFLVLMTRFSVPEYLQLRVLTIGILLALVLRAGLIAVGAAAISQFSWVFFIFAAFLLYTAWNLLRSKHGDPEHEAEDEAPPAVVGFIGRVIPSTPVWHGGRPFVKQNHRWIATPMLITMIAIGVTDVLFALDSIPAIFGLTKEPFLVVTANAFALMGLRQLFFVVRDLLDRLRHLDTGLSVILAFIGVKLVMEAFHENSLPFLNGGEPIHSVPVVPTWASLGFIVAVLITVTITSTLANRRDARAAAAAEIEVKDDEPTRAA